jgi:multimeric flavodoxin WrbA
MAINGSPRKEKSSTNHILALLLEGMRAAGATMARPQTEPNEL